MATHKDTTKSTIVTAVIIILLIAITLLAVLLQSKQNQITQLQSQIKQLQPKLQMQQDTITQNETLLEEQQQQIAQLESQIKTQQEKEQSLQAKLSNPPTKRDIEIYGKEGLSTLNIYLKSNPSEKGQYYSVYRFKHKYEDKPNMLDLDTLSEIKRHCTFLVRTIPGTNSLIYTDWEAHPSKTTKYGEDIITQGYGYIYFVAQDDGDFSHGLAFE